MILEQIEDIIVGEGGNGELHVKPVVRLMVLGPL